VLSNSWFKPYSEKSGVTVVEDSWNGELGKIRGMVETNDVIWDVVNGDYAHAITGCDEGFLERIDIEKLGGVNRFLPGTVHECGVPTHIFAVIFGYDEGRIPATWPAERPKTIADMFDTGKWPGKRAIRKDPKWVLEPALMADGVPAAEVYKVLDSEGGVERALAKLDTIRSDIIWWTSGAQAPQLLADGEVVISQMYANRLYIARAEENKNFIPVWDGQVYSANSWIIPKGANKEAAMGFLEFVTQPDIVANISHNNSSLGLAVAGADPYVAEDVKPYLPTAPENLTNALSSGEDWWADHYEEVNERFQSWLSQ